MANVHYQDLLPLGCLDISVIYAQNVIDWFEALHAEKPTPAVWAGEEYHEVIGELKKVVFVAKMAGTEKITVSFKTTHVLYWVSQHEERAKLLML